MKLTDLHEAKAPKLKAADESARYEKLKGMLAAGHPNVTQRMVDGAKASADSLWDIELKAREKNMIDTHGAEWWDLVKKQYPIEQKDGDWVVSSKIRDWADGKDWPFQYKAQAVEKVQQLVKWLHDGRKRGFGDKDADIEKWVAKLDAVDKAKKVTEGRGATASPSVIKKAKDYLAAVHDVLGAKLTKNEELSGGNDFYDTVDPKIKVCVEHGLGFVSVSVAFLQRKGVWHALGNFYKDDIYTTITNKYGLKKTSVSFDGNFFKDSPVPFARELADKFSKKA